mmetsp:Transcript_83775/g.234741  ORF Transcript_83775/g.234741 Transcript_83775/m.234741 type:complete len:453 (+) Transcript_83775:716-2074(+)
MHRIRALRFRGGRSHRDLHAGLPTGHLRCVLLPCLRQGVLPREHLLRHQHGGDCRPEAQGDQAEVPILPILVAEAAVVLQERSDGQRDHGHELDQNVERRARRVLEGVPDGVAHDASLALLCLLDFELFAQLLAVVPRAAGVRHHDREHRARDNSAREHTHEAARPQREADEERREDGVDARGDHLLDARARGDLYATVAVRHHILVLRDGLALARELDGLAQRATRPLILHLPELPPHLLDDLCSRLPHRDHGEGAEEEGQHRAEEQPREQHAIRDVEVEARAHLGLEGDEQRERGEHRGADSEALARGCCGVPQGVQGVRLRPDLGAQARHLRQTPGVVRHRPVGVRRQGDAKSGEHAHGRDGHAIAAGEGVARQDRADEDHGGCHCADHADAQALDHDGRRARVGAVLDRGHRPEVEGGEVLCDLADGRAGDEAENDATIDLPTEGGVE